MARRAKKLNKPNDNIQKILKAYKLHRCQVNLVRLNASDCVQYRNALFRKYGIQNCCVRIERVIKKSETKKLLSARKTETVRKQVSWLPTISSTQINSASAFSQLGAYQNAIPPSNVLPKRTLIKRQRAISVYAERANELIQHQAAEANSIAPTEKAAKRCQRVFTMSENVTMQEMHAEFHEKFRETNRGLKDSSKRELPNPKPQLPTQWEKLFEEFQSKIAAKKAKKSNQPNL